MNNNKLQNTSSAIFLAAVLVAGVFAISSPLIAYGQQYEQDYDSYYPSDPGMKDKSHSAKQSQKANCDNKNINVNGIDQIQRANQLVDNTLGSTDDASIAGQELTPEEAFAAINGGADPLINAERNILNVCFNDNDNDLQADFSGTQTQTGTGGGDDNGGGGAAECVLCLSPFRSVIETFLAGITVDTPILGTPIVLTVEIDTIEELCALLAGLDLTVLQITALQTFFVNIGIPLASAINIILCLLSNLVITLLPPVVIGG